ncbi:MAG: glycosyltransferase family 4 protein [Caldilineaceae bacterium]|nr:glycosyltransferase family 4 protein [Caldilineaceae bacterium]MBP8109084.1 glycosyltransferase family 4 protein [Caldilineaceae bacterium]MBP8124160.1 glycosyltransferase family 4 protein [Caldilineaceae bacterium]MBP9073316.1 glycosyltransferase family 4 protein [Caldilineaceae bacterium]
MNDHPTTFNPSGSPAQALHGVVNGWFVGRSHAGSGQYTDHLLAHLPPVAPQAKWTVLLPEDTPLPAPIHPNLTFQSIPLPRLPASLAKVWWEQITIPRLARRLRADVLWVPYWAAPWWQPMPTVVTIHDLIPLLLPAYRGGWLNRLYTRLVSATARRADRVLTVSQASARDITEHLGIPAQRITPVHHGPNQEGHTAHSAVDAEKISAKYGLPARYFLYLGGFDVRKNVVMLLLAYKRFLEKGGDPSVKLVIAGKLPHRSTQFAPDPRPLAGGLGLADSIIFTGWVDEADKPTLYALSLGYLFPSQYEGFGMMLLEAMQAGTPVVTSL